MSATTYVSLFVIEGLLFMGLAWPLALGWVRPNSIYGFRTKETLCDPALWYWANRRSGYRIMMVGAVTAGSALLANLVAPYAVLAVGLATAAIGFALAFVLARRDLEHWRQSKLPQEGNDRAP